MKTLILCILAGWSLGLACSQSTVGDACLDINLTGTTDLGFPVVLPIGEEPIVGGGAFPADATIGTYTGTLASVVTEQEIDDQGVARFSLVHYFESGPHAFWTEDQAVCTPVEGNPAQCDVVTEMTIVGGRGGFAGASGSMVNTGRITFTDPTFETSPYGSLQFNTTGEVCAANL